MSSVVRGRFQEDYPESYARSSGVVLEDALASSTSAALTQHLGEVALSRRHALAAPYAALTAAQLRREYAWITERLFGPAVGFELYEERSEDHDVVFRDSVDEVAALWREKFEMRFGRDPPLDLVDYFYPRRTLDELDRRRIRTALDAEFHRLLAEAERRETQVDSFLAIPKGLYRRDAPPLRLEPTKEGERGVGCSPP